MCNVVIMNVCHPTQSLASGLDVHGAADDCARLTDVIAPINHQYHQCIQVTAYPRELLGCRPSQKAKAIHISIRVGERIDGKSRDEVRHGGRTNRQEVIMGVISCPLRVPSPVNSQTGCVGLDPRLAIQTDRDAPGGERWRSTHPPPWLLQNADRLTSNLI